MECVLGKLQQVNRAAQEKKRPVVITSKATGVISCSGPSLGNLHHTSHLLQMPGMELQGLCTHINAWSYRVCVCVCVYMPWHTWRGEDNLWLSVLSFPLVYGSLESNSVVRFGSKCLYALSHLAKQENIYKI